MADRQNGRGKRRKLHHVGHVLSSSLQDTGPADLSTGHVYAGINIDGGGNTHFGDRITINETVNCNHTDERGVRTKKYTILLESLTFERMDARRANIAPALSETCQWVFTHPHFLAWEGPSQSVDHRGFLWLKGKPGCGKSTIMKLVCARASKMSTDQIILTYFFNARASGILEKSSLGLYRSLAYQLLTTLPEIRTIFMTKFCNKESKAKVEEWTTAELKDFLVAIITETNPPPISIFVDALDEGAESDVRDMIAFFESLQDHAYAKGMPLRIYFSSRHYPHITVRVGLEIVVEHQTGHGTDMLRYIRLNLHGDQSASMDELREKVYQKSAGVFLWVVLVVPILNTVFDRGKSLDDASRCLEDIPEEIDALLADILARSDEDIDQCVSLLQWVTFSLEPLTPEQLYLAVLYSSISSLVGQVKIPDHNHVKKYLLHCSRGLVEVTKSYPPQMQFIHETVRGFLLGDKGLMTIEPRLKAGLEGLSHDKLTNACLRYIMRETPRDFDELDELVQLKGYFNPPLLRYAKTHMFSHADAAQRCGRSQLRFMTAINEDGNDAFTKFRRNYNRSWKYGMFKDAPGATPLHFIAEQGLVDLAQCFIQHGVNVNAVGGDEGTSLHIASYRGHVRMVRLLLDRGADISAADGSGATSLHVAVDCEHLEVVQLLLDRGADVNAVDDSGAIALHIASSRKYLDVVRLLLEHGADVNAVDGSGATSLHIAADREHLEVAQLLLDRGADINAANGSGGTSLHIASGRQDLDLVQLLLDRGADVNVRNSHSGTALVGAGNHHQVRELLLKHGASD